VKKKKTLIFNPSFSKRKIVGSVAAQILILTTPVGSKKTVWTKKFERTTNFIIEMPTRNSSIQKESNDWQFLCTRATY